MEIKLVAAEANLIMERGKHQESASLIPITNVLIVGVGGQGTLLASRILAQVAVAMGTDVKVSEVHGMAQRGGSVITQVRFGSRVYSPLVQLGQADYILSFEKLEALRWLPYLKKGGGLIVNDQTIDPLPVLTGAAKYPTDIPEKIKALVANTTFLNASDIATRLGNVKAANVVLLGVLAGQMDLPMTMWEEALEKAVPAKVLELNREAFKAGLQMVK
jgi:indolepyruvate ferredoxin oxidoreductase beta subunit